MYHLITSPNAFRTTASLLALLCAYLFGVIVTGDSHWLFSSRSCGGDSYCLAVKRQDYFKEMANCMSGVLTADLRSIRAGTECMDNLTAKIKRDPDYTGAN